MAKQLKQRDLSEKDEGPYLTRPNHDAALEAQLNATTESSAAVSLNPNPLGAQEYVGTDPIYQNYSTDANKPFASEDGVDQKAEEAYKELHSLEDVDEDQLVDDPGLGGKTTVAKAGSPEVTRYLLPGQEGYDEAADGDGQPRRADTVGNGGDSKDEAPHVQGGKETVEDGGDGVPPEPPTPGVAPS